MNAVRFFYKASSEKNRTDIWSVRFFCISLQRDLSKIIERIE